MISGNVIFEELDLKGEPLRPSTMFNTLASLPVFREGDAPILALIVRPQLAGEADPEVEINTFDAVEDAGAEILTIPLSGALIAQGASVMWPGEATRPPMRSNYELRWWPGQWNCIHVRLSEIVRPAGLDAHMYEVRTLEIFRHQGEPIAEPDKLYDRNDPESWPRLPGTTEGSTSFPPQQIDGENEELRLLQIIWPLPIDRLGDGNPPPLLEMQPGQPRMLRLNLMPGLPANAQYRQRYGQRNQGGFWFFQQ
jgi:hypothetical protein